MTRKHWIDLGSGLIVGAGILASTLLAFLTAESGWLVLIGPLVLALAVVTADLLGSRPMSGPRRPSRPALFMGGSMLFAAVIVAARDPALVKTLVPALAAPAWVTLVWRPQGQRNCQSTFAQRNSSRGVRNRSAPGV